MKTSETINMVCSDIGISKADLAKRMGMLPSSFYRKLSRESMSLEELEKCLDILGITVELNLKYPDGHVINSQANYEMLLQRVDLLERTLETEIKAIEFQKKALRDLRTSLNNAVGYTELGMMHGSNALEYLEKIEPVLNDMVLKISYALGEPLFDEIVLEEPSNIDDLEGKRVLIVDDNQLNREILKEILVNHNLSVEEAGNGSEALYAVCESAPGYFDFILMDIEMPEMDGYESTMRIRNLPNRIRANIPIIALTANSVPENRERAEVVGMDDFLVKPTTSAHLLKILAKYK